MIEFMQTKHTIDGVDFTLSKMQPTSMDEVARRKLIVTTIADTAEVEFTAEGFELFKAIMREY